MYAPKYFPIRYFAPRFFPPSGIIIAGIDLELPTDAISIDALKDFGITDVVREINLFDADRTLVCDLVSRTASVIDAAKGILFFDEDFFFETGGEDFFLDTVVKDFLLGTGGEDFLLGTGGENFLLESVDEDFFFEVDGSAIKGVSVTDAGRLVGVNNAGASFIDINVIASRSVLCNFTGNIATVNSDPNSRADV